MHLFEGRVESDVVKLNVCVANALRQGMRAEGHTKLDTSARRTLRTSGTTSTIRVRCVRVRSMAPSGRSGATHPGIYK